jgi:hypothetical protein
VAVVPIGGDHLVAIDHCHLHADDDRFLADIKVTETADEAHAVKLAGLFFKAADQKHFAVGVRSSSLVNSAIAGSAFLAELRVRLVPALVFFAAAISLNSV